MRGRGDLLQVRTSFNEFAVLVTVWNPAGGLMLTVNPMNFMVMIRGYIQRCMGLGTATDDALAFAKNMTWQVA